MKNLFFITGIIAFTLVSTLTLIYLKPKAIKKQEPIANITITPTQFLQNENNPLCGPIGDYPSAVQGEILVTFKQSLPFELANTFVKKINLKLPKDAQERISAHYPISIKVSEGQEIYFIGKFYEGGLVDSAQPNGCATINSNYKTVSEPKKLKYCESSSDCIFVSSQNNNCPQAVNKNYASNYENSCEGINFYLSGNSCQNVIKTSSRCSWNEFSCPGNIRLDCINNTCKIGPCGIPKY